MHGTTNIKFIDTRYFHVDQTQTPPLQSTKFSYFYPSAEWKVNIMYNNSKGSCAHNSI